MGRTTRPAEAVGAARTNVEPVDQVELTVEGMTCATCATRVERTLQRQPGVAQATVNFAAGRAHLAYRPQAIRLGELQDAVKRIGYRIAPVAEQPQATASTRARSEPGGGGCCWHGRWRLRCCCWPCWLTGGRGHAGRRWSWRSRCSSGPAGRSC